MNTKHILFSLLLIGCATSNMFSMEKKHQAAVTGAVGLYSGALSALYGTLYQIGKFDHYIYLKDRNPNDSFAQRTISWHLERIKYYSTRTVIAPYALMASVGCGAVSLASMAKTYDLCKNDK